MTTALPIIDLTSSQSFLDCIISPQTSPQKYESFEGINQRLASKASKKSQKSNRSRYSNKNKLVKSTLYEMFKRQKAGKMSTVVQQRNMQINILEQSYKIQQNNAIELKIAMKRQFNECRQSCNNILLKLDQYQ